MSQVRDVPHQCWNYNPSLFEKWTKFSGNLDKKVGKECCLGISKWKILSNQYFHNKMPFGKTAKNIQMSKYE